MKQLFLLLFSIVLFSSYTNQILAQDCMQPCTVDKEVGEGVFLGVQIFSSKCLDGCKVVDVVAGTQAEKMGLKKGDIIKTINNEYMESSAFMVHWIQSQEYGFPIQVELLRDGKTKTIHGSLGYKEVKTITTTICCDQINGKLPTSNFVVYPNPSNGRVQIKTDLPSNKEVQLFVIDFQGNTLFEQTLYPTQKRLNQSLQIAFPKTGEYILMLVQDGKSTDQKVVFSK